MALANVNLKFGVNMDSFRTSMQNMEKSLDKAGKKMQSIGKSMSMFVTLPLAALGAASIKAASDAEETFSKFDTVFRDIQGSAESAFRTLRNEYGLSSIASKQMLGDTGDLLTGFGFSQQGALDLSLEVNKLAVDLASFTNYSGGAKGASEALTKALLGERDSLKALGISILEEDVKKQMAINSAKGLTFESERQAKAQATLQLAIQQSGNAIGDYARTSDSFANQSRLLQARLSDISVELGTVFLPLATKLVNVVTGAVNWFSSLDSGIKTTIAIVGGLVAAIGPLLAGLGFLISNILPMLKAGMMAVSGIFSLMTLKIVAVVAVVGSLILVGKAVIDSWETVKVFFGQMWDKIKILFIQGVANTLKVFNKFTSLIGLDFSKTIEDMENNAKGLKTALDAQPVITFGDVMSDIGGNIMKTFSDIKGMVTGTTDEVKKTNNELANTQTLAGGVVGGGSGGIKRTQDQGISAGSIENPFDTVLKLPEGLAGIADRVRQYAEPIWAAAQELTDTFGSILTNGAANGIASMATALGQAFAGGTSVVKALGGALLGAIGQIAVELGKASIAIGIGMIAIKKAFSNPYTAIAAGIALIALGSFISSKVSKMTSGGGGGSSGGGDLGPATSLPARAMGGSVQMGRPYLVGERGPELFTPSGFGSITNTMNTAGMMGGGGGTIHIRGEFIQRGKDLVATIDENVRVTGRTT